MSQSYDKEIRHFSFHFNLKTVLKKTSFDCMDSLPLLYTYLVNKPIFHLTNWIIYMPIYIYIIYITFTKIFNIKHSYYFKAVKTNNF